MASELYHVKQQFTLGTIIEHLVWIRTDRYQGAYKSLVEGTTLPDPSSPEYTSILLYKARASIAIHDTPAALAILPADSDDISVKSVVALAKYEGASSEEDKEAALEQLRDLCIEIESEGEVPEADVVRVIAGTAFYTAGEVEEALETLGAGTTHENLEAYVQPEEPLGRSHGGTDSLQCCCDSSHLSVHPPTRPSQEGVRPLEAMGRGRLAPGTD